MCSYWATYDPLLSTSGGYGWTIPTSHRLRKARRYFSSPARSIHRLWACHVESHGGAAWNVTAAAGWRRGARGTGAAPAESEGVEVLVNEIEQLLRLGQPERDVPHVEVLHVV